MVAHPVSAAGEAWSLDEPIAPATADMLASAWADVDVDEDDEDAGARSCVHRTAKGDYWVRGHTCTRGDLKRIGTLFPGDRVFKRCMETVNSDRMKTSVFSANEVRQCVKAGAAAKKRRTGATKAKAIDHAGNRELASDMAAARRAMRKSATQRVVRDFRKARNKLDRLRYRNAFGPPVRHSHKPLKDLGFDEVDDQTRRAAKPVLRKFMKWFTRVWAKKHSLPSPPEGVSMSHVNTELWKRTDPLLPPRSLAGRDYPPWRPLPVLRSVDEYDPATLENGTSGGRKEDFSAKWDRVMPNPKKVVKVPASLLDS